MKDIRLGINIDHVATLRESRGENYPSLVAAAKVCLEAGADQITIHLREDRRHIQDSDIHPIKLVTEEFNVPLNFEMGCNEDIINIAILTRPAWICLVPENRKEKTTEGGLNLLDPQILEKVKHTCKILKEEIKDLRISLFIESNQEILEKVLEIKKDHSSYELIDAVEIHTGEFASAFINGDDLNPFMEKFKLAAIWLKEYQIGCHAGHGLTDKSFEQLLKSKLFIEYNIGHFIICESVFKGLKNVVRSFKDMCHDYS